ncbi:hypothetical protein, partial [Bacillus thuringiensis]|uniref:hypothetical protein n=1 Tax=Bacillus thuringiensis TaxID=1428 RepID=UPI0028526289
LIRPEGFGIKHIIPLEVTDFLDPDPPTFANVSLLFYSKVTSCSSFPSPAFVSMATCEFVTSQIVLIFTSPSSVTYAFFDLMHVLI